MSPEPSEARLTDHSQRHGQDFGAGSAAEYHSQASSFLTGRPSRGTEEITRSNGDVVRYNQRTDEFGVVSSEGAVRTYYKPDPELHKYRNNEEYFRAQAQ